MNYQERQQFQEMVRKVEEMTRIFQSTFNPDGSIKVKQLEIQPKDTAVTAASGSVRVETNIGPINVLVA
jgi:hypothetical protein